MYQRHVPSEGIGRVSTPLRDPDLYGHCYDFAHVVGGQWVQQSGMEGDETLTPVLILSCCWTRASRVVQFCSAWLCDVFFSALKNFNIFIDKNTDTLVGVARSWM